MRVQLALRNLSTFEPPRVLLAARIIHPFPTLLNVAATAGLAAIAAGGLPAASELARLMAAMFCVQAAIGASNDYCDRELDAQTKLYKPIVRGLVSPRTALLLAAVFILAAGALVATMGPWAVVVGALGLAAGLAYNVRLKRTVLSPLPFMIALPALPIWVWVSLDSFTNELWWLLPFAPLAALAVHLSNTAPDIEADSLAGIRGLPHILGVRRALFVAWGSFASALILAAALGFHLDYDWQTFLPGALTAAALLVVAAVAHVLWEAQWTLQLGFGLISIATAVLAGAWLAAI